MAGMNRQTEKVENTDDYIKLATKDKQEFINKLGRLEDIEEEIGCPLDVIFKVIANKKVYIELPRYNYSGVYFVNLDFSAQDVDSLGFFVGGCKFLFSNYKDCFWLNRDKSE